MHITLDFIPNHTSDEHPWFLASKANKDARENVFRSYYVWTTGNGENGLIQPNNWVHVFILLTVFIKVVSKFIYMNTVGRGGGKYS